MKETIKSRLFIAVFLATYFSFFGITIGVLDIKSAGLGAGHFAHGFPFTYYYSNCYGGVYFWQGLVLNVFSASLFSFGAAWFAVRLWRRSIAPLGELLASPELRRKWYL